MYPKSEQPARLLYVDRNLQSTIKFIDGINTTFDTFTAPSVQKAIAAISEYAPDVIVLNHDLDELDCFEVAGSIRRSTGNRQMKVGVVAKSITNDLDKKRSKMGIDFLLSPLMEKDKVIDRISDALPRNKKTVNMQQASERFDSLRVPLYKRAMDIVVSGTALLFASPIMLLTAIALKIESKAPIIYKSKRVGMGYKIFEIYKFRSMVPGADAKIKDMAGENMYGNKDEVPSMCMNCDAMGIECHVPRLYIHGESICEIKHLEKKNADAVFKKFSNDPRVTFLGKFIRKTSIDELPQLFNVLKGDMSLIGNRPLPLYEAEKVTNDKGIERFLAPAGITGLWQVLKRGKADMSEEERIELDNVYARNYGFKMDMQILLKTIPALLQSSNV